MNFFFLTEQARIYQKERLAAAERWRLQHPRVESHDVWLSALRRWWQGAYSLMMMRVMRHVPYARLDTSTLDT